LQPLPRKGFESGGEQLFHPTAPASSWPLSGEEYLRDHLPLSSTTAWPTTSGRASAWRLATCLSAAHARRTNSRNLAGLARSRDRCRAQTLAAGPPISNPNAAWPESRAPVRTTAVHPGANPVAQPTIRRRAGLALGDLSDLRPPLPRGRQGWEADISFLPRSSSLPARSHAIDPKKSRF
jgi:hypothetical protein